MATLWTIDRVLRDPNLLGAALGDAGPWKTWLAVLRAAFGLPLDEAEAVSFRQVAGDRAPPGRRVRELWAEYNLIAPLPEGRFFTAFGHLGGYTSAYYTYMWSLVIAKDLFSAFDGGDLFATDVAHRYRDRILAAGGSKDAADLVEDFLGRPYTFDAYAAWLAE